MGKKASKGLDPDHVELALESLMVELAAMRRQTKKLSANQKATRRELRALREKFEKASFCKCAKKKKSGSGKKGKSASSTVMQDANSLSAASMTTISGIGVDDLKMISGVGPKLEETLNELGVFRFE